MQFVCTVVNLIWLINLLLFNCMKVDVSRLFYNYFFTISPADTWRLYNVGSTSMQRHDVASTLRRRCINVMCLLGLLLSVPWEGCGSWLWHCECTYVTRHVRSIQSNCIDFSLQFLKMWRFRFDRTCLIRQVTLKFICNCYDCVQLYAYVTHL